MVAKHDTLPAVDYYKKTIIVIFHFCSYNFQVLHDTYIHQVRYNIATVKQFKVYNQLPQCLYQYTGYNKLPQCFCCRLHSYTSSCCHHLNNALQVEKSFKECDVQAKYCSFE